MHMPGFVLGLTLATVMACMAPAAVAQQGAANPQQERMKSCNADAAAKKLAGDARKSFMSDCLSGKPTSAAASQQEKMKTCNAKASDQKLAGDVRKQFMSSCLKG